MLTSPVSSHQAAYDRQGCHARSGFEGRRARLTQSGLERQCAEVEGNRGHRAILSTDSPFLLTPLSMEGGARTVSCLSRPVVNDSIGFCCPAPSSASLCQFLSNAPIRISSPLSRAIARRSLLHRTIFERSSANIACNICILCYRKVNVYLARLFMIFMFVQRLEWECHSMSIRTPFPAWIWGSAFPGSGTRTQSDEHR